MDLSLFPLKAVLFPGGRIQLRVFETRYVDMVRECLRSGRPFGVCLIAQGGEVGAAAVPEPVGCSAAIADCDMQQLGVLQLQAVGTHRFRIAEARVGRDQLLRAGVEPIGDDADLPLASRYQACADLLARILDQGATRVPGPHRLDSTVWVGNRLSEVLSIPLRAKQRLMELTDADARLAIVDRYLRQHRVLD